MNIVLCTINPSIELAWREAFVDFPALHPLCEILTGNITELAVDAVVSPANSFGFMDGGIDLHYSTVFGWHVQERLQAFIKTMAVQELPVGEAVAVETGHGRIKYVIAAPTMRTPCVLHDAEPVYLAARAATVAASRGGIETLAFPGMGMGTGRLFFGAAARAMLEGIHDGLFPKPFPRSLRDVMEG